VLLKIYFGAMAASVSSAGILAMSLHLTSTGALKNIFWSHASQRVKCRDFSNVITFDMMHKTNKHRMPLAMFVGSNHQLLNIVFGHALLRDEPSDSFEWLFRTFKACMGECEPHVLLIGTCCFSVQCIC
jgi:hypothetical protein